MLLLSLGVEAELVGDGGSGLEPGWFEGVPFDVAGVVVVELDVELEDAVVEVDALEECCFFLRESNLLVITLV